LVDYPGELTYILEVINNLSYIANGRKTFAMVTTNCFLDHYFHFSN